MCRARSPCLFEPCCCWGFRGAEEVDRRGEEGRRPPHTLQRSRVASGWSHGPQSSVGVLRLGPQAEEAGCDGAEPPPHERAPVDDGHAGMLRHKGRGAPMLQAWQGGCGGGAVRADNQPQKGSGGRDALPPIWKCLLQASRVQTSLGAGSQAASGETPRAEIPGDLQLKTEGELPGSSVDLGRSIAAVPRAAREWARCDLRTPAAKLSNPTGQNLCYANSCFQAWYWMSQLVDSASHIGGQVRPGYKSLVARAIGTCPAASYLVPSSINGTRSISSMMQVNSGSTSCKLPDRLLLRHHGKPDSLTPLARLIGPPLIVPLSFSRGSRFRAWSTHGIANMLCTGWLAGPLLCVS